MKYVYGALNWIFGIIFILTGLMMTVTSPLAGLPLVIIALLLLPPARKLVHQRTNRRITTPVRTVCIIVLFITYGLTLTHEGNKLAEEQAEREATIKAKQAAQRRQQRLDSFTANRENIISSIEFWLSTGDYQSAATESAKYLDINDEKIKQLHSAAKEEQVKVETAERTKELIATLKTVPVKEYEKNRSLYQELVDLHPDNNNFKNKLSFYKTKIEAEKRQQLAAKARQEHIENQFSPWDGSHRNLVRLIKKAMNDPSSYKHVETVYWDKGDYLIVRTTFRGKNAFGGVVRNFIKAKVSLNGQILKILEQT